MNDLPDELERVSEVRFIRHEERLARLARLSVLGEVPLPAESHPKSCRDLKSVIRSLLRRVCERFVSLVRQEPPER